MKWVYFIRPIGMDGPVKIGTSCSPDTRLKTLATWSPFALEIVAKIRGAERLEMQFHALLQDSHERREWFTATPEVKAVIDAVIDGTFDLDSLPEPKRLTSKGGKPRGTQWTPEQRYRSSVFARLRSSGVPWSAAYPAIREVARCDALLENFDEIERTIARLGGKRTTKNWRELA